MSRTSLWVFPLLLSAAVLAACSSTPSQQPEGAPVTDAGATTGVAGTDAAGAATMGVGQGTAWTGSPLDNPDNLLYTKVIYFDFDRSEVRQEDLDVVRAHAEYLAANPYVTVTLQGHADERGSREYNIALGERRADAVKRLMAAEGASPVQINTVSYGEEQPVAAGDSEDAWALNRRVEIVY
jgi:peptidoglycan-associated lipoprotein